MGRAARLPRCLTIPDKSISSITLEPRELKVYLESARKPSDAVASMHLTHSRAVRRYGNCPLQLLLGPCGFEVRTMFGRLMAGGAATSVVRKAGSWLGSQQFLTELCR